MIRAAAAGFLGALSLVALAVSGPAGETPPAEVGIAVGERSGCSGVHIGGGLFLTAAHCTSPNVSLRIDGDDAEVLWANRAYDVALVRAGDGGRAAARVDCRSVVVGEDVHAVTEPYGLKRIRSSGKVAGEMRKLEAWREVVPLDLMIGPGSSGGPVFDSVGAVVGVVVAAIPGIRNMALMVPATAVCELMGRQAG